MQKTLGIIAVACVTFVWASLYWLGDTNLWQAERLTSLELYKPWIYRQLVPLLARLIASLGIRVDLALVLVVTASGVCFYLALRELVSLFHYQNDLLTIGFIFAGLLMFGYDRLPYDLMTAFLFTLALVYLAYGWKEEYLLLFIFICLNRETAILLPAFCFASYKTMAKLDRRREGWWVASQLGVYLIVTTALHIIFVNNPGSPLWFQLPQNVQRFANHPLESLIHFGVTLGVLWLVLHEWQHKPYYLRLSFMIFAPALLLAYLIFGEAFEVRVLWECYAVIVVLTYGEVLQWLHNAKVVLFLRSSGQGKVID